MESKANQDENEDENEIIGGDNTSSRENEQAETANITEEIHEGSDTEKDEDGMQAIRTGQRRSNRDRGEQESANGAAASGKHGG